MNEQNAAPSEQGKRDFLKYVLSGGLVAWVGSIVYPLLAYLSPPKQAEVEVNSVKVGAAKDIPNESGQIVRFGNKPLILIRNAKGEFRAFDATCTHLDCTVQFKKDMGVIWCACHNGKYDLNGVNIAGPPPRPLAQYRVLLQGDDVLISKNE